MGAVPLIDRSFYTFPEALELIGEKLPGEDPLDCLVEALSVPFPNEKLRAWVVDEATGRPELIPPEAWGSEDFHLKDSAKGIGSLWVRRERAEPWLATGPVHIFKGRLDWFLSTAQETPDEGAPTATALYDSGRLVPGYNSEFPKLREITRKWAEEEGAPGTEMDIERMLWRAICDGEFDRSENESALFWFSGDMRVGDRFRQSTKGQRQDYPREYLLALLWSDLFHTPRGEASEEAYLLMSEAPIEELDLKDLTRIIHGSL